jgi:hypothetical protein
MGFGGIIAGALQGGAAQAIDNANTQIAQNNKIDFAKLESQLATERDAASQNLRYTLDKQGKLDSATGPLADAITARKVQDTTAVGQAQTGVDVDRTQRMTPALAAQTTALTTAKADAERASTIASGDDPKYTSALKAITAASHFYGPQDQLAAQNLKRMVLEDKLRDSLASEKDPQIRADINRQIADISGKGETPADIEKQLDSAARAHAAAVKAASDITLDPSTREEAKASIAVIRNQMERLNSKLGAEKPGEKAPYAEGTELRDKSGQVFVVKDGKPVPKDGKTAPAKESAKPVPGIIQSQATGPDQGVAGLSENTLERMANDPSNPLQKAAADRLRDIRASRVTAAADRVTANPSTDPSLYQ